MKKLKVKSVGMEELLFSPISNTSSMVQQTARYAFDMHCEASIRKRYDWFLSVGDSGVRDSTKGTLESCRLHVQNMLDDIGES